MEHETGVPFAFSLGEVSADNTVNGCCHICVSMGTIDVRIVVRDSPTHAQLLAHQTHPMVNITSLFCKYYHRFVELCHFMFVFGFCDMSKEIQ